jgi:Tfp pilus assembly protein PilX
MTDEYISPYPDDRISRDELERLLRGNVYMRRLTLAKLIAANATDRAVKEAENALAAAEQRAREEGVAPWASK